jgi:hypothetical protein
MSAWTTRHWLVAVGGAATTALVIGLPTDVIPNPVFGRSMGVTWWSYPVLLTTAVLAGLLVATYVRDPRQAAADDDDETIDRPTRTAGVGGLLSFFAVGCPVCNKLVLVALGSTGAVRWFEPLQPLLALISVVLLVAALRARLRSSVSCAISPR